MTEYISDLPFFPTVPVASIKSWLGKSHSAIRDAVAQKTLHLMTTGGNHSRMAQFELWNEVTANARPYYARKQCALYVRPR